MASWKFWLFIGVLDLSLAGSAWSQQTSTPAAPAPGSDAKSYVDFGIANGAKGDLNGAVSAFTQAISLDPKYAPAYYNRGLAYSLQDKKDDAQVDFSQAIQLDPNYKEAYYHRGSLYGQKGDLDDANSDFSEVIKLDPKFAPAYYNSGHVEYFKGDLDSASSQVDQALSLDPNSAFSYYIRGLIRHAQGHREQAMADFQKSSGLNFPYAAFWVWITEMENSQFVLAREDLSNSLAKPEEFKPDDWPSQIGNYLIDKITQDQLIAKAKTNNDTETNSRLCEAWFYSGMHSRLSGDSKGAKDCFTNAAATGAKGAEEFVEANRQLSNLH